MLQKIAFQAACRIGQQLQASEEENEVYAYSIEIILVQLIQSSVYITIAAVSGYLLPTLLVMVSFSGFKFFAGGPHLNTFLRCLIISGLIIFLLTALSMPGWPGEVRIGTEAFMFLLALYGTWRWVPAGTEKKTITDPVLRKRQKMRTLCFLLFLAVILLKLEFTQQALIAQTLVSGVMGSALFLTPWGYRVMGACDQIFEQIKEAARPMSNH